jgi:prepilin-type N-terminal cleavage/methylation domain-containing protein
MHTGRRRAFTLVELLVTIVIVSVLALLAVPTYQRVVASSQDANALSELRSLHRAAWALAAIENRSTYGLDDFTSVLPTASAAGTYLHAAGSALTLLMPTAPSQSWGEVSLGLDQASSTAATSMRSRSGQCVWVVSRAGNELSSGVSSSTCLSDSTSGVLAPAGVAGVVSTGPEPDWATLPSPPGSGLSPVLECVVAFPDHTGFTAFFGYNAGTGAPFGVPVGANNGFTPAPQGRGQPQVFYPGRQVSRFTVAVSGFSNLVWRLNGRTSTASYAAKSCGMASAPTPTSTVSPGAVTLSWPPFTSAPDLSGWVVSRDGVQVAALPSATLSFTDHPPPGPHTYRLVATASSGWRTDHATAPPGNGIVSVTAQ